MIEIRLPARFLDDHESRSDLDPIEELGRNTRGVLVRLTDEQLADVITDADYYATTAGDLGLDPQYRGLTQSAAATLTRLARAGITYPARQETDMSPIADPDAYSPVDRPQAEPRPERLYSRGTPVRNLRLDDDRWAAVQDEAARTGSTASDVIRAALDGYLDRRP